MHISTAVPCRAVPCSCVQEWYASAPCSTASAFSCSLAGSCHPTLALPTRHLSLPLAPPPAGKTVEMLALFLANPPPGGLQQQRQQQQDMLEGEGAGTGTNSREQLTAASDSEAGTGGAGSSRDGGSSGAGRKGSAAEGGTLVVCPPALLQQWQSELANHAHGALVVELYDGLRSIEGSTAAGGQGGSRKRLKPAQREAELYARLLEGDGEVAASFDAEAEAAAAVRRMQAADVVLTSFDVLRAEVRGKRDGWGGWHVGWMARYWG